MRVTRHSRRRTGGFFRSESEQPGGTGHGSCHVVGSPGRECIARHDRRCCRCSSGAGVLTAITRQVDAVYRVSLDYVERSRPATATETAELGPLARGFRVVGLAATGTAREATTRGSVDVLLFPGRRGSRPIP